jgi:hypothetical protein
MATDPEQAAERFCFSTSRRGNLSVTVEMEPNPSGPWVSWDAYATLLAERDRLVERLAAQSGWAEDDELARLREDKARLDWLEEASVIPTMFDNLVAPDPCFITREFADGGIRCHRGVGVRGAIDDARAAATPEGSDA